MANPKTSRRILGMTLAQILILLVMCAMTCAILVGGAYLVLKNPTAAPTKAAAATTAAPTSLAGLPSPTAGAAAASPTAPAAPAPSATARPTTAPTAIPTEAPTAAPSEAPTEAPTAAPTEAPTEAATAAPTQAPLPTAAPGGAWPGNALSLNGWSSFVSVPDNNTLDDFKALTIEVWVLTPQGAGAQAVVSKFRHATDDLDDAFYLGLDENGRPYLQVASGNANGSVTAKTVIADGRWHHLAGVWTGAMLLIYVDGVQEASQRFAGSGQLNGTNQQLSLGRTLEDQTPARYFEGMIDEVHIWNLARTADEILVGRFLSLTGAEPGLMACWSMDEAPGSQLIVDRSQHGNDGTLRQDAALVPSSVPLP
jgi:hypothetical protein